MATAWPREVVRSTTKSGHPSGWQRLSAQGQREYHPLGGGDFPAKAGGGVPPRGVVPPVTFFVTKESNQRKSRCCEAADPAESGHSSLDAPILGSTILALPKSPHPGASCRAFGPAPLLVSYFLFFARKEKKQKKRVGASYNFWQAKNGGCCYFSFILCLSVLSLSAILFDQVRFLIHFPVRWCARHPGFAWEQNRWRSRNFGTL